MGKINLVSIILPVLLFTILIVNFFWLTLNNSPIPWDPAAHTWITLELSDKLKNLDFISLISVSNYYPIFVHLVTAIPVVFLNHFATDPFFKIKFIQFFGSLFLVFTITSMYFYALELFNKKSIALFSVIFFSLFPIVYFQSHWLYLDIPLTGILVLALLFLKKSEELKNKKFSLLFFVFAGFLVMTKWTGIIYLVIPSLLTLVSIVKNKKFKSSLKNVGFGLTLFSLIVAPWYLTNLNSLENQTKINIYGEEGADPVDLFSLENISLYLKLFLNYQVTPILGLLFFVSAISEVVKKNSKIIFLISMILFSYIGFTFISNKDPRYTMPFLPFVAMILGFGAVKFINKFKQIGKILTFGLILFYIGYFFILNFRPSNLEGIRTFVFVPILGAVNIIDINDPLIKKYDLETWRMDEILSDLNSLEKGKKINLLIGAEYEHLNPSTIKAYLKANLNSKVEVKTPDIYFLIDKYNQDKFPNLEDIEIFLQNQNYALIPVQQVGTEFLRNKKALEQLRYYFNFDEKDSCKNYTENISPNDFYCTLDIDEVLTTGSDFEDESGKVYHGSENIQGPKRIYCKWGCSFSLVRSAERKIKIELIKTYTLPNLEQVNLYKIN